MKILQDKPSAFKLFMEELGWPTLTYLALALVVIFTVPLLGMLARVLQ